MGMMGSNNRQSLQGNSVSEEERSGGKWEPWQSGIEPLCGSHSSITFSESRRHFKILNFRINKHQN